MDTDKIEDILRIAQKIADVGINDPEKITEFLKQIPEDSLDEEEDSIDLPDPPLFKLFALPEASFSELKAISKEALLTIHEGRNLLFPASQSGDPARVQWLLSEGLDIDQQSDFGYTPIMSVINSGVCQREAMIDLFIAHGANLEMGSAHGETPFRLSSYRGDYSTALKLISAGIDWQAIDFTPLHQAAAQGNVVEIEKICCEEWLEAKCTWKRTPWLTAVCADQVSAAECLAKLGAKTFAKGHLDTPALHLASRCGALSSVSYLFELGADIHETTEFGDTALHEASSYGHVDVAQVLLENGANISKTNSVGEQPINDASNLAMLELLHAHGADLNYVDGCGYWPLKSAVEDKDMERITWLLRQGANVNAASIGETALHTAVRFGTLEIVQWLVEAGADINVQDADGDSVLFGCGSIEIATYLVSNGIDLTITNCCGDSALEASYVNKEVREYFSEVFKR